MDSRPVIIPVSAQITRVSMLWCRKHVVNMSNMSRVNACYLYLSGKKINFDGRTTPTKIQNKTKKLLDLLNVMTLKRVFVRAI